jgi:hypothetical protein
MSELLALHGRAKHLAELSRTTFDVGIRDMLLSLSREFLQEADQIAMSAGLDGQLSHNIPWRDEP